jgi:hypothetical protein
MVFKWRRPFCRLHYAQILEAVRHRSRRCSPHLITFSLYKPWAFCAASYSRWALILGTQGRKTILRISLSGPGKIAFEAICRPHFPSSQFQRHFIWLSIKSASPGVFIERRIVSKWTDQKFAGSDSATWAMEDFGFDIGTSNHTLLVVAAALMTATGLEPGRSQSLISRPARIGLCVAVGKLDPPNLKKRPTLCLSGLKGREACGCASRLERIEV